jgi:hypothetical protein
VKARLPSLRLVAALKGSSLYFTGIPCCRGHLCARRTVSGNCVTCHRKEDERKAGLAIHGGEHPDQLAFRAILADTARTLAPLNPPETPATVALSRPYWRQPLFPFLLPVLQWENP